jgi:hypothetical protein
MYTNYAPSSKAVYDETGRFPLLANRTGRRYYLRSATEELLGKRVGSKGLLRMGDRLVNEIREKKLKSFQPVNEADCRIKRISGLGPDHIRLIEKSQSSALFGRDAEVFNWILEYPWVREYDIKTVSYPFSYKANKFDQILLEFKLPHQSSSGLIWMVVHNHKLSVPYLFYLEKEYISYFARTIVYTMIAQDCAFITVRDPGLKKALDHYRSWFLTSRNMPQLLFAHKNLISKIPGDRHIRDGDGDVVFTG